MRWTAHPERREIFLVILCLTLYFLAYNLDTLAMDGGMTRKILYKTTGFGQTRLIGPDGRKPPGWRDTLEIDIYGDWVWEEGHVVGHLRERSQPIVATRHGASWIWKRHPSRLSDDTMGPVHEALQRWGNDIPQTRVLAHVPGELLPVIRPHYVHYSSIRVYNYRECLHRQWHSVSYGRYVSGLPAT